MPKYSKYGYQPRTSKKVTKVKKMVDGYSPISKPERMVRANAPLGKTISALARQVSAIQRTSNIETKFRDVYTSLAPGTSALFTCHSAMQQGSTDQNRIGNSIKCQSIQIQANIAMNESAVAQTLRCIIFVDKENDGADPTGTGMLLQDTSTAQSQLVSRINKDFSKRFVILKDKSFNLQNYGTKNIHFKYFSKLDFHTLYDGATSAVTDFKENQVYTMWISDDNTIKPAVYQYSRLLYTDN